MCVMVRHVNAYVHAVVRHAFTLCVQWCAISLHMCMLWCAMLPCYVCCGVPWHTHMQYDVCVCAWLMALDPRGA